MEEEEIKHIKCACCGKNITKEVEGEIEADTHFNIIRSYKDYSLDSEGFISVEDEDIKMEMEVCKECFDKILNESPTLGKVFLDGDKFIY